MNNTTKPNTAAIDLAIRMGFEIVSALVLSTGNVVYTLKSPCQTELITINPIVKFHLDQLEEMLIETVKKTCKIKTINYEEYDGS